MRHNSRQIDDPYKSALESLPPFAKLYLGIFQPLYLGTWLQGALSLSDQKAKLAEYCHVQKTISRLKGHLSEQGPLELKLENGKISLDTAASADRAADDALWMIAYICKRFGGESLWDRNSGSRCHYSTEARARHILEILKVMKPEKGRIETVLNVLCVWERLEFLLLAALRKTPLSGSLLESPWYWKYIRSRGPAKILATVQELKYGTWTSNYYSYTSADIRRLQIFVDEPVEHDFQLFLEKEMLFLVTNHFTDLVV